MMGIFNHFRQMIYIAVASASAVPLSFAAKWIKSDVRISGTVWVFHPFLLKNVTGSISFEDFKDTLLSHVSIHFTVVVEITLLCSIQHKQVFLEMIRCPEWTTRQRTNAVWCEPTIWQLSLQALWLAKVTMCRLYNKLRYNSRMIASSNSSANLKSPPYYIHNCTYTWS